VWARQSDANKLIEALKSMGERHGWLQHDRCTGKRLEPIALQASLCSAILIKLKDRGVVPADWALHDAAKSFAGSRTAGIGPGQPKTIRRSHLPWAASCASWEVWRHDRAVRPEKLVRAFARLAAPASAGRCRSPRASAPHPCASPVRADPVQLCGGVAFAAGWFR
jgi:hypothetical protein